MSIDDNSPTRSFSVPSTLLAGLPLFTLLPLGQDFFLPAIFSIGQYFDDQHIGSLAITVYMVCWGIGQVIWGGVVDAIGYKTSAILGLLMFAGGSLLVTTSLSDNHIQFLAGRAIQSLGGAGCFTTIFAIVRQRFEGEQLNRGYSYLYGVLGFVPVAAPVVGGFLLQEHRWQFLFDVMAVLGAISVIWVAFALRSTTVQHDESSNLHKASMLSAYAAVLKNKVFLRYMTIAVLVQTLFLYYLSYGPAYLIGVLGMNELGFGQQFTLVASAFLLMSFLAPQVLSRFTTATLLKFAMALMTLACLLMFSLANAQAWYAVTLPMIVMTIGITLVMTSCPARALQELKSHAGVASGLYSAAQFGLSAAIAAALFTAFDSSDLHNTALASLGCLLIPWTLTFFSKTIAATARAAEASTSTH